jgi:OPA family glycerol-3-phosphate transporter-like MFS transporter
MTSTRSRILIALCASAFIALFVLTSTSGPASGQPAGAPEQVAPSEADGAQPSSGEPTGKPAPTDKAAGEQPSPPAADTDQAKPEKKKENKLIVSAKKFLPILILVIVVAFVISRLPKVEGLGHTDSFLRRRVMNWLPLGLTYAFLYMGRYNLKVSKFAFEEMQASGGGALMDNADFGIIFGVGTIVYGFSFLINGPLTDKHGGKFSILVGAAGSAAANLLMGLCSISLLYAGPAHQAIAANFVPLFSVLYGINMYFQSFGAVAIVKVNAPWFHVRERGVFGAIFGILISLGIYFAFDWGALILDFFGLEWVFLVPAILLAIFWVLDYRMVENSPGEAGHDDFDTADASSGDDGEQLGAIAVFKLMLKNPIIMTIALIEFCSGFLRQSIMQWFRTYAKQTDGALGLKGSFVYENWGMLLCCAGILGGVMAGIISDRVFGSRRGPVAFLLYGVMLAGGLLMTFAYDSQIVGWLVILMSMAVIGVHGMLSGTASMDFGGRKNVGIAVGIIDGFVYLGTAVMSFTYALVLPKEELTEAGKIIGPATEPENWSAWPISMVILSVLGLAFASRVWNAAPKGMKK